MLKWWKEKGSNFYDGARRRWRFLQDCMQEKKKKKNPHMDPQLNQLQLPQLYHLSMINTCWLLTWASSRQLPSSSKANNKPDYLVSSSWSHTAAQPCFSMIDPWIPTWRQQRVQTEVCVHVCVCGTEQRQGSHHVFISVTALHPTSAVQLQESPRGVFCTGRKTSVVVCC